jgi:curved DNA-binding protein CbpA
MDNKFNYYKILGVLEDAEDIVIRAAYKALAQKYHPDKWLGDKKTATERMKLINDAYNVLSDPEKRKEYDLKSDNKIYSENENTENYEDISDFENNWNEICKYFPDLHDITNELRLYSVALENTYKIILSESKDFDHREFIKEDLKSQFLRKYFGSNETIINFAEYLFTINKRKLLIDLNKAINLLGNDISPELIIKKIDPSYDIEDFNFKSYKDSENRAIRLFIFIILIMFIVYIVVI